MEDTMVSIYASTKRTGGSFIFVKSHIRFLNNTRPLSISVFVYGGLELALGISSFGDGGFGLC
jgi:hypothetical protein